MKTIEEILREIDRRTKEYEDYLDVWAGKTEISPKEFRRKVQIKELKTLREFIED